MSRGWQVSYSKKAVRWFRRRDKKLCARVAEAIREYAEEGSGDIKLLTGLAAGTGRIRVGTWRVRVIRDVAKMTLHVEDIASRGQAYKRWKRKG